MRRFARTLEPTNIPGYMKDKNSNVVIHDNLGEYQRIVAARKKRKEDDALRKRVDNIEKDIKEILEILRK